MRVGSVGRLGPALGAVLVWAGLVGLYGAVLFGGWLSVAWLVPFSVGALVLRLYPPW